jgi:phosphoribosylformylglycinamidine synthase
MARPFVIVLRAAGINCDEETQFAWESVGARAESIHINELIRAPRRIDEANIVTLPGGFSYGDDIAAGKVLANLIKHHVKDELARLVDRGGVLLGICNGFQVLIRAGLLPGADCGTAATLTVNDSGRYEDRWVRIAAHRSNCAFFERGDVFECPAAHGEGKLLVEGGDAGLQALKRAGRVAMTYVAPDGSPPAYPDNPSGSVGNVAALTDATGRILGIMPHPERNLVAVQRPDRTRDFNAENAGPGFFASIVRTLA